MRFGTEINAPHLFYSDRWWLNNNQMHTSCPRALFLWQSSNCVLYKKSKAVTGNICRLHHTPLQRMRITQRSGT